MRNCLDELSIIFVFYDLLVCFFSCHMLGFVPLTNLQICDRAKPAKIAIALIIPGTTSVSRKTVLTINLGRFRSSNQLTDLHSQIDVTRWQTAVKVTKCVVRLQSVVFVT